MIWLDNTMSNTEILAKNLRHMIINVAGYSTPNHFCKAFKFQSSTMSRLLSAEISNPSITVLNQLGAALDIPWWALFATDLTQIDVRSVDWSKLAKNQSAALQINADSVEIAKHTAETLLRALLVYQKAANLGELSEEQQTAVAHSIGEGIIKELLKAQSK